VNKKHGEQEDNRHPEGSSRGAHYTLDTCAHFSNVISHAPPRVCYPCRTSRVLSLSIAIAIASKKTSEETGRDECSKDRIEIRATHYCNCQTCNLSEVEWR